MDYWCSEQLVVTVNGPTGRSVVSLSQPFARVGSHPDADVVIPDESVARRSLYLHATSEGVFCLFLDVASSNPDERGSWLDPDQDVPVGAYRVRASLLTAEVGDARPAEGLATWGSAPPPLPVVLIYCGDLLKDKRRFRARLSPVGRRPQCGLQLKGKLVSSFHCVLYWDRAELWCVDLNSSNGTSLNGAPLGCAQVNLGDRLDVGEFGLVFQRLSSGGQRLPGSTRRGEIPEQSPPHASQEVPGLSSKPATRVAPLPLSESVSDTPAPSIPSSRPVPAEPPALPAEQVAQPSEERRLREQLAEEVARLGREREILQARWDLASEQLQRQIAELHDEAARLASERQALEIARSNWNEERHSLTSQLAARSDQLTIREVELTNTASALTARLADVDRQPDSSAAAASVIAELLSADIAPATIITGITDELPGHLADLPDRVQQILPDLLWNAPSAEQIAAGTPADAPLKSAAVEQLQAQWEETSERLRIQIEQLQEESAELSNQRIALERSRQQWQSERQSLNEQLSSRAEQLAHVEADLAATTAALKQRRLEERSKPAEAFAPDDAATSWPADVSQFAPAAIVAGFEPDAAGQVAAEFAPEVAWTYAPTEPGDSLPTSLDPQAEIQARWEATSQQFSSQVEQLRADRQSMAEHLLSRQQELALQQAESTAATSSLAPQRGDVEQQFETPQAAPAAPEREGAGEPWSELAKLESVSDEPLPPAGSSFSDAKQSDSAPQETTIASIAATETPDSAHGASFPTEVVSPPWTPAGPGLELTDPGALFVAGLRRDLGSDDPDDLTSLVSERLAEKDSLPSLDWLWWSAGGMAVAAALAAIVIAVLWVL